MPARSIRILAGLAAALALALTAMPASANPVPKPDPRPPAGGLPAGGKPAPAYPVERGRGPCNGVQQAASGSTVPAPQRFLNVAHAWTFARGRGQTVAVIDTGVARHPRLPGLAGGGDYVNGGDGLEDCDVHGTVVAGIIAAAEAPGDRFAGVAPEARIVGIRQSSAMFQKKGAREPQPGERPNSVGDLGSLARAIRHAADFPGVTVINISEVSCQAGPFADGPVGAAVQYATVQRNVVIVAAAGNADAGSGCAENAGLLDPARPQSDPWKKVSTFVSPAWYDDVLTVGSVNAAGVASKFTVAGPWVDVAAPGEEIVSLDPRSGGLASAKVTEQGTAQPNSGTSFAAPFVAGTVALVRERFPQLSAREVMARIKNTAHPPAEGWNPQVGHGIIDPVAAVTADLSPGSLNSPNVAVARQLPLPVPPPAPDNTARNVAIGASGAVAGMLVLGTLASFPIRRRFALVDSTDLATGRRAFAEPPKEPPGEDNSANEDNSVTDGSAQPPAPAAESNSERPGGAGSPAPAHAPNARSGQRSNTHISTELQELVGRALPGAAASGAGPEAVPSRSRPGAGGS